MESTHIALYLILQRLSLRGDPCRYQNRRLVQNGIYLAGEVGVDLGYHFAWCGAGFDSSQLSQDMCDMARQLRTDPDAQASLSQRMLPSNSGIRLITLRQLMQRFRPAELTRGEWWHLVGNMHFLMHRSGLSRHKARSLLYKKLPELHGHEGPAWNVLQQLPARQ